MLRSNRIRWSLPRVLLLVLMTFMVTAIVQDVCPDAAYAQSPATIKGTVQDKESGEFLDYANVLLKGTTRGTMTLGQGKFYFNGLAPGTYTVRVLYLGFAPTEQTVTVAAGEGKTIVFELETVIVEQLQAFDVEGEEYMVEVKSAREEHTISSETFEKYAIDSVEDAISKQAGVVSRAGEIFVRGGRSGELANTESELIALRKDGETFPAIMNLSFTTINGAKVCVGILRDLS